jgi:hypothetical protein
MIMIDYNRLPITANDWPVIDYPALDYEFIIISYYKRYPIHVINLIQGISKFLLATVLFMADNDKENRQVHNGGFILEYPKNNFES